MPLQLYKIASTEVGSAGASTIDFTSIPQGYTDLLIKLSTRSNATTIYDYLGVKVNGSTSSIYNNRYIRGDGSGASSGSTSSAAQFEFQMAQGNGTTANTFSNCEIYIPNYTASINKSASVDIVGENNATTIYMAMTAGLWASTSAITSLSFFPINGTLFQQYTTVTLYGIL